MILIVDDSVVVCRQLTQQLTSQGLNPVYAPRSLDEARELLGFQDGETLIEVVLLDLIMPNTDGLQFLTEIRTFPHLQDIPVIIVTSLEEQQQLERVFAGGANDYLTKPPLPVVLAARVRNLQRLARAMRERQHREKELLKVTDELKQAQVELEKLSLTDQLTGVPNRRAFDLLMQSNERLASRMPLQQGLIMIDIDHFKAFNDLYGHPAGDACLKAVAQALQGVLRRSADLLARYGGEEFALVLPETDEPGVKVVGERLREAVLNLNYSHKGNPLGQVSISLGGASLKGAKAQALIDAADQALYQAKHQGRNRLVMNGDGETAKN